MIIMLMAFLYIGCVSLIVKILSWIGVQKGWRFCVVIVLMLLPFGDVLVAKGILHQIWITQRPLQHVTKTVNQPRSVLWIDEVWPGFDEYGRNWMVRNYLDGKNLTTLALNDGNSNIYVFQATSDDYSGSTQLRPEIDALQNSINDLRKQILREQKAKQDVRKLGAQSRELEQKLLSKQKVYEQTLQKEVARIVADGKIYSFKGRDLPIDLQHFSYRVQLSPIKLQSWKKKFVWCDNIEIFDQQKKERIAFSKRCLGYSPWIGGGYGPGIPFYGGLRLGDEDVYKFDDKVVFRFSSVKSSYDIDRSDLKNHK